MIRCHAKNVAHCGRIERAEGVFVLEGVNTKQPQKFHAHIKFGPLV